MNSAKSDKRNIAGFGFVSLMNDVASEMIYPLLPIFLTSVLHASAFTLGLIEGIAETTVSILKYLSGAISDRIGKRKPIVTAGYAISNLLRPFIGIAASWWHVLFLRVGDRVGKGIRTSPRDALLADSTTAENRGFAFGFQRSMDHLGAVIGPLVATALLHYGHLSIKAVFLFSLIPGTIAVALAYFLIAEKKPKKAASQKIFTYPTTPQYSLFLITIFIFTLGNSTDAFLLLKAQAVGISIAMIPIIWMTLHISKALFSIPGGRLSDKIGRKPVIIAGWMVYGLTYLGFAFSSGKIAVWMLFIVYGLYFGLCEGTEKAFVAELVPEENRGSSYGMYNLAIGIGALPASLIFGIIWDCLGMQQAFMMGASLALLSSMMLIFVRRPIQNR
jgi:MFS family permease